MKLILLIAMLSATPILAATGAPAGGAESHWIADLRSGCKLLNPDPPAEITVTWDGPCTDGFAEGSGTVISLKDGKQFFFFEGTLHHGMASGRGVLKTKDYTAVGAWKDGLLEGPATVTDATANRLDGNFEANRIEGPVKIVYADGHILEVNFSNSKPEGSAILTEKDGTKVAGVIQNNVFVPAETSPRASK